MGNSEKRMVWSCLRKDWKSGGFRFEPWKISALSIFTPPYCGHSTHCFRFRIPKKISLKNFVKLSDYPAIAGWGTSRSSENQNEEESFEKILYALLIRDFWTFSEISGILLDNYTKTDNIL
jgi:hypothetical protein